MTPTVNSIRKLASRVRKSFSNAFVPCDYDEDLAGACAVTSAILTKILQKRNIEVVPIWGEVLITKPHWASKGEHAWVWLPEYKRILDITCTQFGKHPKVRFSKPPPIYTNGQKVTVAWLTGPERATVNKMVDKFWRMD